MLGNKNVSADALSQLPNMRNQNNTHRSNYTTKIFNKYMTWKNWLKERFLKLKKIHNQKDPKLKAKLKCAIYQRGWFWWSQGYYQTCNSQG